MWITPTSLELTSGHSVNVCVLSITRAGLVPGASSKDVHPRNSWPSAGTMREELQRKAQAGINVMMGENQEAGGSESGAAQPGLEKTAPL